MRNGLLQFLARNFAHQFRKHSLLASDSSNVFGFRNFSVKKIGFNEENLRSRFSIRNVSSYETSDQVNCPKKDILNLHPNEFSCFLKEKGISRCFVFWNKEKNLVETSHSELTELVDWFGNDASGYRQHEAVFMHVGIRSGCLMAAFVSNTNRGQAYGSTRMRDYKTMEIFLREGLKWSQMVGYKIALAGLWYGGGNSIIVEPTDRKHCMPDFRMKMFHDYGDFITGLNGCFIAGEGMGLHVYDLNNIHSRSRFVNCVSDDIGGSGNPSIITAKGVIMAMEAALDFLNFGEIEGKKVAVQGAGSIGYVIISELIDRKAAEVFVTDCNQKRLDDVHDTLSNKQSGVKLHLEKVSPEDNAIFSHDCDILVPCASSYVLSKSTIPQISAKIICGAANNQLQSPVEDCRLFEKQGSTYVVDFVANRMAIVNSAIESYGRLPFDPAISRNLDKDDENSIYQQTKRILEKGKAENVSAVEAAYRLAEEYSNQLHPVWPNRSQLIIQALVSRKWHLGIDFWRKRRNFPGFGGDV